MNETPAVAAPAPAPQPVQVNMGQWLSAGWNLVMANLGSFIVLTLIYLGIVVVASSTAVGYFLVYGPLTVGFYLIIFSRMRGQPFNIGDIAQGFNFFVPAVLANLVMAIFISMGLLFCIIPGLILMAAYLFVYPLILEKKMDFWTAMETSRKAALGHLFELTIFVIVLGILLLLGVLFCGVGALIAIPWVNAATAYAYRDFFGLETQTIA